MNPVDEEYPVCQEKAVDIGDTVGAGDKVHEGDGINSKRLEGTLGRSVFHLQKIGDVKRRMCLADVFGGVAYGVKNTICNARITANHNVQNGIKIFKKKANIRMLLIK